jgi:hypothetical protein
VGKEGGETCGVEGEIEKSTMNQTRMKDKDWVGTEY